MQSVRCSCAFFGLRAKHIATNRLPLQSTLSLASMSTLSPPAAIPWCPTSRRNIETSTRAIVPRLSVRPLRRPELPAQLGSVLLLSKANIACRPHRHKNKSPASGRLPASVQPRRPQLRDEKPAPPETEQRSPILESCFGLFYSNMGIIVVCLVGSISKYHCDIEPHRSSCKETSREDIVYSCWKESCDNAAQHCTIVPCYTANDRRKVAQGIRATDFHRSGYDNRWKLLQARQ